jgi:hypothetical protein
VISRALVVIALAGALGCGAKTGLDAPRSRDAGTASLVDSGLDAGVDGGPVIDVCIELPHRDPPRQVNVDFLGRILSADVLFLVDTTGSMTEEIEQIRESLRDRIVPALADAIGDVRFSVASLADFPVGMYGERDDVPFILHQASTDDIGAVQRALDRLPSSNGQDGPESQTEALYQAASGSGIGTFVPPASCPAGTVGYPCFRSEGSRIFLLFTDAEFHNGPTGTNEYLDDVEPAPHSYPDALASMESIGAKVLGLFSGGSDRLALRDLEVVARDTGAVDERGEPIVIDIGPDGRSLGAAVVDAVQTVVDEVPIDIDLVVEDVEGDDLDATDFVREIVALRAAPVGGAQNRGDRFDDVRPGTRVFFSVALQNEILPPSDEARSYLMRIVLRGDGVTRLDVTVVQVVIPGVGMETCREV